MSISELTPVNDSRASFYGKAKIVNVDKEIQLHSYDTHVATINNGKVTVNGTYSTTTLRHIKEFLLQHGFKAENKKQIMEDYGV
jgi:hypothetical protein